MLPYVVSVITVVSVVTATKFNRQVMSSMADTDHVSAHDEYAYLTPATALIPAPSRNRAVNEKEEKSKVEGYMEMRQRPVSQESEMTKVIRVNCCSSCVC